MLPAVFAFALALADSSGRSLFLNGRTEARVPTAQLRVTDLEMPATRFACASCHGRTAAGGTEGGVRVPAIDGAALSRAGYDASKLARALRDGVRADGAALHPVMPSYRLTDSEIESLLRYLTKLPDEDIATPGVSESAVRVGAAVPLSGPDAPVGSAIRAALQAAFSGVNLYGRKVELVTADSAQGQAVAVRSLIAEQKIFALVGSLGTPSPEVSILLKESETPTIAPIASSPENASAAAYYLLPTVFDQIRVLADYLHGHAMRRPAALYSSPALLEALRQQMEKHETKLVYEAKLSSSSDDSAAIVGALRCAKADAAFIFGSERQFEKLALAMDAAGLDIALASVSVAAARAPFRLPPQIARRVVLAHGSLLAEDADLTGLQKMLSGGGSGLSHPAIQALAAAGGRVFCEAAKRCGRNLNQAKFIGALESLQEFETGFTPPVTFSAGHRIGSSGAYMVGVDPAGSGYLPLSDWLVPQQ